MQAEMAIASAKTIHLGVEVVLMQSGLMLVQQVAVMVVLA